MREVFVVVPVPVEIRLTTVSPSETPLTISVLVALLIPVTTSVRSFAVPFFLRMITLPFLFSTNDVPIMSTSFLHSITMSTFALIPLNIELFPLSIATFIVYEVTPEVCVGVELISLTVPVKVSNG